MAPTPKKAEDDSVLCPSCSAIVSRSARECPECGEVFKPDAFKEFAPERGSGRLERLLFYVGLLLVLAGGPGIALGSWLHDVLSIPIIGTAFTVFGPLNRFVAALGLIVLIVGIVLLIVSIRMTRPAGEDDYDVGTPKKA